MNKLSTKAALGLGLVPLLVLSGASGAFAAADEETVEAVGSSALTLKDTLASVGGVVLPYAAAVLGLCFAWLFAVRLFNGR